MSNEVKSRIHFAWWVLLGLSIMAGFARGGINSAGGLFLKPVSDDLGIGLGSLSLYFSISSIAMMLFLPMAGKMMAKYNIRIVLIVGIILQAGSFAMFGLMNSVWGWYIFAVPMAIGSIFVAQMAGPVLINNWFKKHNGLALGIMMATVGALGAVIQPMVGNLIVSQGWRNAYIILGVAVIIIVIPVILLLIRMAPQQKGLLPYGMEDNSKKVGEVQSPIINKGISAAVAKKSMAFYALVLYFFFVTSIGAFTTHVPAFAETLGYNTEFAGNVMGKFMIGMLLGALAFGYLTDRIGAKKTAIFAMLSGLVSIAMLLFLAENPLMFKIAMVIFGFVTASIGTLGPLLTTALFGNKEYSQIYAAAAVGLALAGIISLPIYGFVYDATGGYTLVLYSIIGMLLLNIVCIIMAFKGKKKLEQAGQWN